MWELSFHPYTMYQTFRHLLFLQQAEKGKSESVKEMRYG